jgi:cell wall-associated NlpC family hydrolase
MEFKWTAERVAAARARLEEFDGTPHVHRRAVPGVGVDCVHLVIEALRAAGAVDDDFRVPGYRRNAGVSKTRNEVEDEFLAAFDCEALPPGENLLDGDIIIFAVRRTTNHVGIVMSGHLWHCLWSGGTINEELAALDRSRVQSIIRLR